tara:strand:- start:5206 stop:6660 length:1455 start_codon:yes stop_codon:yes gene_type:complete
MNSWTEAREILNKSFQHSEDLSKADPPFGSHDSAMSDMDDALEGMKPSKNPVMKPSKQGSATGGAMGTQKPSKQGSVMKPTATRTVYKRTQSGPGGATSPSVRRANVRRAQARKQAGLPSLSKADPPKSKVTNLEFSDEEGMTVYGQKPKLPKKVQATLDSMKIGSSKMASKRAPKVKKGYEMKKSNWDVACDMLKSLDVNKSYSISKIKADVRAQSAANRAGRPGKRKEASFKNKPKSRVAGSVARSGGGAGGVMGAIRDAFRTDKDYKPEATLAGQQSMPQEEVRGLGGAPKRQSKATAYDLDPKGQQEKFLSGMKSAGKKLSGMFGGKKSDAENLADAKKILKQGGMKALLKLKVSDPRRQAYRADYKKRMAGKKSSMVAKKKAGKFDPASRPDLYAKMGDKFFNKVSGDVFGSKGDIAARKVSLKSGKGRKNIAGPDKVSPLFAQQMKDKQQRSKDLAARKAKNEEAMKKIASKNQPKIK